MTPLLDTSAAAGFGDKSDKSISQLVVERGTTAVPPFALVYSSSAVGGITALIDSMCGLATGLTTVPSGRGGSGLHAEHKPTHHRTCTHWCTACNVPCDARDVSYFCRNRRNIAIL